MPASAIDVICDTRTEAETQRQATTSKK